MEQKDAPNGQNAEVELNKEAETQELSMESLLAEGDFSLNMPRSGEVRTGVIASVTGDEILVSIGAKSEGVIPSREISQLPADIRESLVVGQEVQVLVISPESKQGNLLLSIQRAMEEEDWTKAEELMQTKDAFESEIAGYNKGGLIVNLGNLPRICPRITGQPDAPDGIRRRFP